MEIKSVLLTLGLLIAWTVPVALGQNRGGTSNQQLGIVGRPPGPPVTAETPEFNNILRLLVTNQGIDLGSPVSNDDRQNPALPHYQLFQNGFIEMQKDGTIYVGYLPLTSPVWYDPSVANDSHNGDPIPSALRDGHT